jgi:hypothetical protein
MVYDSINNKINFEIIFVGPEPNTISPLWKNKNVKFIRDYGSPVRCLQLGLINSVGDMVTLMADDCIYTPDCLLESIEKLENESEDEKNVVITKYTEGGSNEQDDNYYKMIYAYPFVDYKIEEREWLIFNSAIGWRSYYENIGGWDCRLQTPAMSYADFSLRAQRDKCKIHFIKKAICNCGHMPNRTGDHAPIHDIGEYDIYIYRHIYNNESNRIKIDINNWRLSDNVWARFTKYI